MPPASPGPAFPFSLLLGPGLWCPCRTRACRLGLVFLLSLALSLAHELSSGLYAGVLFGVPSGDGVSDGGFFPWRWRAGAGRPGYEDPNAKDYVVVVSMCRNASAQYLDEWIRHHQRIGVDKMILYDDFLPGSPRLETLVEQSFVRTGFVEIFDARPLDGKRFFLGSDISVRNSKAGQVGDVGRIALFDKQQKMQLDTWRMLLRRQVGRKLKAHVWLGNVDDDEFYNPKQNRSLKEILNRARVRGARSVRTVKLDFGSSGHEFPPLRANGSLRVNYVMRDPTGEKHTGLALVSAITGVVPGCTHVFLTNSMLADLARGSHECNDWHGDRYPGHVRYGVYYSPQEELAINHYRTKSYSECRARECIAHPDGQFSGRDCLQRKSVCDDSIYRHLKLADESNPPRICSSAASRDSVHARVGRLLENKFIDSHHFSLWTEAWHYVPACNSQLDDNWGVCRQHNSSHIVICNDRKHGSDKLWVEMNLFERCIECLPSLTSSTFNNKQWRSCISKIKGENARSISWNGKTLSGCEIVKAQYLAAFHHLQAKHIFDSEVRIKR